MCSVLQRHSELEAIRDCNPKHGPVQIRLRDLLRLLVVGRISLLQCPVVVQ
jgi:hypothetical protein